MAPKRHHSSKHCSCCFACLLPFWQLICEHHLEARFWVDILCCAIQESPDWGESFHPLPHPLDPEE